MEASDLPLDDRLYIGVQTIRRGTEPADGPCCRQGEPLARIGKTLGGLPPRRTALSSTAKATSTSAADIDRLPTYGEAMRYDPAASPLALRASDFSLLWAGEAAALAREEDAGALTLRLWQDAMKCVSGLGLRRSRYATV